MRFSNRLAFGIDLTGRDSRLDKEAPRTAPRSLLQNVRYATARLEREPRLAPAW